MPRGAERLPVKEWTQRALAVYTRYFTVWVVLFGALAYAFPAPVLLLKPGMTWFFSLTMFGIGVALKPEDFARIARRPGIVAFGSAAQFTIMPLSAWLLARALRLPDELAIGLILTGSAPGAMSSNVMSYLAGADTAYSVSLTTVSTLLCPLLTPLITAVLAGARMDVPFAGMMLNVFLTVVLPLLAGFALRSLLGARIEPLLPAFPALSATFIVFICSLVIAMNREHLAAVTGLVLAVCLLLNLSGMGMGYGAAALIGMNTRRRRTLSIEIGMQNAGLGVVLALKYFGDQASLPCAVFVFLCIITGSIAAAWWQRHPVPETDGE